MSDYNLPDTLSMPFPRHTTGCHSTNKTRDEITIYVFKVSKQKKSLLAFSLMWCLTSLIAKAHDLFGKICSCSVGGRHRGILSNFSPVLKKAKLTTVDSVHEENMIKLKEAIKSKSALVNVWTQLSVGSLSISYRFLELYVVNAMWKF